MTYHYYGIDAEESILTESVPNLETGTLPKLFFIINQIFSRISVLAAENERNYPQMSIEPANQHHGKK